MAVRTLIDTDSVQLVYNKWFEDVRQYAVNVDTLFKHGTINAALANIGTVTKTTIIVTENTAVNANTDLTNYPNISWVFWGSGKLTPAVGVTLILYSGDTIHCPPYQNCLDASSGTITFAKPGWVWPGWFGATPGVSASAGKTAMQKLAAAFGSVGGGIHWPGHTVQIDDTIAFTGPVIIRGINTEHSILETTADASGKHAVTFTRSHTLEHLQLRTSVDLTQDRGMYGARMDLDGVTVSGGGLSVRWHDVKVRGFNNCLYADGGDAYNIDRLSFSDLDLKTAGPASDYIGSCIYANRVLNVKGTAPVILDQNNTGEHALYFFGSKNIDIEGFTIRNATKGEAQAIKLVGNGVAPDDDQAYPTWNVRNMDIQTCLNGILCGTYGTETLEALTVENCKFVSVDGTASILGNVHVSAAGTSSIRTVTVRGCSTRTTKYQGVHVSTAVGATIGLVKIQDCNAYDWSRQSAGTYTWFGTTGTGTFGQITLGNIVGNGNSNGRTLVGTAGQATTISRINLINLSETNTTAQGWPVATTDADTTPSLAIGNRFTIANTGATSITQFDNLMRGEVYTLLFSDGNTTLVDGTNLICPGSANLTPGATDVYSVYSPDGTKAYVSAGSNN